MQLPSRRQLVAGALGLMAMAAMQLTPSIAQAGILEDVIQRGVIRIAYVGNPPKQLVLPNGDLDGYDIEIARLLAADLNVDVEFVKVDTPGRITALQTGKADITIGVLRTTERATSVAFTNPYNVTRLQLITLADRSDLVSEADISDPKFTVAMGRGGTAETDILTVAPGATPAFFNSPADQVSALQVGQVDAIAQDNFVAADLLEKHPGVFKVLEESGGQRARGETAIALPRGDYDWWNILNQWVDQFNASGKNHELFVKWFKTEPPKVTADF